MNYATAADALGTRETRKIGNNTYLQRRGDTIAVKLHATDVVTFTRSGSTILDSGGWQTVTTKARINDHLPNGWHVASERGVWGLYHGWNDRVSDYQDGITITRFGNVRNGPPKTAVTREKKFRAAVGKFANDYTAMLRDGQLEPPDAGDCLYCAAFDRATKPGDKSTNDDHLRSHVEEAYYVPSLIFNAFAAMGDGGIRRQGVLDIMQGQDANKFTEEIALRDAPRAIRRYILKSCGLAA